MVAGVPEANDSGQRAGVGIATVRVTNDPHGLAQVVHIHDEQAQPGIEGPAVIVDSTLGAGQGDRVAVERGWRIRHFAQQHVVAVDVLLAPRLVFRRVFVQVVAVESVLRERLRQDGKWLGG